MKKVIMSILMVFALSFNPVSIPDLEARYATSTSTMSTARTTSMRSSSMNTTTSTMSTTNMAMMTALFIVASNNADAVETYHEEHGNYPDNIDDLHEEGYIKDSKSLEDWSINGDVLRKDGIEQEKVGEFPDKYVHEGSDGVHYMEIPIDKVNELNPKTEVPDWLVYIVLFVFGLGIAFMFWAVFFS